MTVLSNKKYANEVDQIVSSANSFKAGAYFWVLYS